jgi:hypothetical protein
VFALCFVAAMLLLLLLLSRYGIAVVSVKRAHCGRQSDPSKMKRILM